MRYYKLLSHWNISIFTAVLLLHPLATIGAASGDYTASAHANSGYGVKRNGMPGQYLRGNCAHCHEQHLSIDDSEPTPVDGLPSDYLLLSNPETACFACHGGTVSGLLSSR